MLKEENEGVRYEDHENLDMMISCLISAVKLSADKPYSFRTPKVAETHHINRTCSDKTGLAASYMSPSPARNQIRRPVSLPPSHQVSRVFSPAQASTSIPLAHDEQVRSIFGNNFISTSNMQLNPGANTKTPQVKSICYLVLL